MHLYTYAYCVQWRFQYDDDSKLQYKRAENVDDDDNVVVDADSDDHEGDEDAGSDVGDAGDGKIYDNVS